MNKRISFIALASLVVLSTVAVWVTQQKLQGQVNAQCTKPLPCGPGEKNMTTYCYKSVTTPCTTVGGNAGMCAAAGSCMPDLNMNMDCPLFERPERCGDANATLCCARGQCVSDETPNPNDPQTERLPSFCCDLTNMQGSTACGPNDHPYAGAYERCGFFMCRTPGMCGGGMMKHCARCSLIFEDPAVLSKEEKTACECSDNEMENDKDYKLCFPMNDGKRYRTLAMRCHQGFGITADAVCVPMRSAGDIGGMTAGNIAGDTGNIAGDTGSMFGGGNPGGIDGDGPGGTTAGTFAGGGSSTASVDLCLIPPFLACPTSASGGSSTGNSSDASQKGSSQGNPSGGSSANSSGASQKGSSQGNSSTGGKSSGGTGGSTAGNTGGTTGGTTGGATGGGGSSVAPNSSKNSSAFSQAKSALSSKLSSIVSSLSSNSPQSSVSSNSSTASLLYCCMPALKFMCLQVTTNEVCKQSQGIPAGSSKEVCAMICEPPQSSLSSKISSVASSSKSSTPSSTSSPSSKSSTSSISSSIASSQSSSPSKSSPSSASSTSSTSSSSMSSKSSASSISSTSSQTSKSSISSLSSTTYSYPSRSIALCYNDNECLDGLCLNGLCVPKCLKNTDCLTGLCVNGYCSDAPSIPSITPNEYAQLENAFSDDTSVCLTDVDCAQGERCVLNRCLIFTQLASLPAFCGNARIEAGETCDIGIGNADKPNAYCRSNCSLGGCGDSIFDTPIEQCDDGNSVDGDGCSAACTLERTEPTTLPAQIIELPFESGELSSETSYQEYEDPIQPEWTIDKSPPPSTPDSGPATLAVMLAGGAAGWLWRRRK